MKAKVATAAVCLLLGILFAFQGTVRGQDVGTFTYQGVERHYLLYRSSSRTGPLPVVVALHGMGGTAGGYERAWTMNAIADREGFNVLYPTAVSGRWAYVDTRPVPLPDGHNADDAGFILALLDKLVAERVVDPARIYVTGASNGALLTWTFACQFPERIAAVAPVVSGMLEPQMQQCHPKRLVPLMVIAGTDDPVQLYDGIPTKDYPLLSIPETLQFWRHLRGCTGVKREPVPAFDPDDPTEAVLVEWTDCTDPSPQKFYRIEGGGHSLPTHGRIADRDKARHGGRSRTIETAEVLWAFFRQFQVGNEPVR